MFLTTDPQTRLDLYHQRSEELIRQAEAYRAARRVRRRRSPIFLRFARSSEACAPA